MTQPALDYFTARPILELMLAQQELEVPTMEPEASLPVFDQFLALPFDGLEEGGSFQVDLVTELTEAGLLILSLCRQVQGPAIYVEQRKAAAYRTVGIRWTYPLADVGSLESKVLWARDYPDQDAFLEAVTTTPEWQFAVANTPQDGEAFVEDADELLSP